MTFRTSLRSFLAGPGVLVVLALAACSQFTVHSPRDPAATFAGRRTFAWLPISEADPADQRVLDPYIDARIRAAVATQLEERGYSPAGSAQPDLLLNYRLTTQAADERRGDSAGRFVG